MAADLPTQNTSAGTAHTEPLRRDPWLVAWRAAASDEMLVFALLGLALLLLLAAWLPQAPTHASTTHGDLAIYSRWVDLVQKRFGSTGAALQALGLFSILDTILFRVLLGLAGCALAVRLVEYVEAAWAVRLPPAPPDGAPFTISHQAPARIVNSLPRRRFRVTTQADYVVVDYFPLADVARVLAVSGALVLLSGLALSATLGWRSQDILIGVNELAPVGRDTSYALRLDSLQEDAAGRVTLLRETESIASGIVTPGRGVNIAGLWVSLQDIGPAVRASATLSNEHPLDLLAMPTAAPARELLLRFTPDQPDWSLAVPDARLLVILNSSPLSPSPFNVSVRQAPNGESLFEGNLPPDGIVHIHAITLTLAPETYANLTVTYDPGIWPAVTGWLLSIGGLMGTQIWPSRRTWLRAQDEQTHIIGDVLPPGATTEEANQPEESA